MKHPTYISGPSRVLGHILAARDRKEEIGKRQESGLPCRSKWNRPRQEPRNITIRFKVTRRGQNADAALLRCAGRGNEPGMTKCLIKGGNVNERLPGTGETVLHVAAATGARDALRLLIQIEGCDFLIRDNCGRLASEVAFVVGNDPAVARLLRIKERKQAKKQGVDLLRRT